MAKKKVLLTIDEVAYALVEQNQDFKQELIDNDGKNYQIAASKLKPLLRQVGEATGSYVKLNELAWACVNAATGTGTVERLQLKL